MSAAGGAADALLSQLTDMGFEPAAAAAALRATSGGGGGAGHVEAAVLWLCGPDAEGAAGDAAALGEPATGVPAASAYAVVNPDGTPSPAWVARVDGEFKVATQARYYTRTTRTTRKPVICAPTKVPYTPRRRRLCCAWCAS